VFLAVSAAVAHCREKNILPLVFLFSRLLINIVVCMDELLVSV